MSCHTTGESPPEETTSEDKKQAEQNPPSSSWLSSMLGPWDTRASSSGAETPTSGAEEDSESKTPTEATGAASAVAVALDSSGGDFLGGTRVDIDMSTVASTADMTTAATSLQSSYAMTELDLSKIVDQTTVDVNSAGNLVGADGSVLDFGNADDKVGREVVVV